MKIGTMRGILSIFLRKRSIRQSRLLVGVEHAWRSAADVAGLMVSTDLQVSEIARKSQTQRVRHSIKPPEPLKFADSAGHIRITAFNQVLDLSKIEEGSSR